MTLSPRARILTALCVALPAAALAASPASPKSGPAPGGRTIYCCDDANGRPQCGDVLPTVCYGRAYREVGPNGVLKRHVEAPLTQQEIARREADSARRKDEEVQQLKQRRLDQALLETYASLADLDSRQERAIGEIERGLAQVREREAELVVERKRVATEAESYRGRELPRKLVAAQQSLDAELAAQRTLIDTKQRELETARARFAADRRRYAELTGSGAARR